MAKTVSSGKVAVTQPNTTFATLASMSDGLQLSPNAVEGRVEPYELVELFYGSGSGTPTSPTSHITQVSPHHSTGTSSPEVMQVIHPRVDVDRAAPGPYTCEVCGRTFREASHYTKHKRGALCRKLAQRMAKKTKKKKNANKQDWCDRARQTEPHKPYECTVCGAKFCDRGNVELHLERRHHTRQKLWVMAVHGGGCCPECDRWFADRNELEHHQRQHQPSYLRPAHPIPATTTTTTTSPPGMVYYPEPLQQVTPYPSQPPPPGPHLVPQPTHPPPQPPATGHMHPSVATTLLPPPQLASPPSLIPVNSVTPLAPPAPAHPPIASLPAAAAATTGESFSKASRSGRGVRPGSTKWNMCGDCGHRFVDPMNLELHLQRHHPASRLLDTVTIAGNTMLYRTDHTRPDLYAVALTGRTNLAGNQTYECLLCGCRDNVHNHVTNHLQSVHGTSNINLIHVVETPEPTRKVMKRNPTRRTSKDSQTRHVCEACGEVFPVKVELIRHRVKDKRYKCGVCCVAFCSQDQVSAHMSSQHPGSPTTTTTTTTPTITTTPTTPMVCWLCGTNVYSTANLDDHLKGHGVLRAECVECGECRGDVTELLTHLKTHLPLQPSRVCLSLSQSGQAVSTHEVQVTLDGCVYSSTNHNTPSGGETPTSWAAVAYACSECGACLSGAPQLEAHLQIHQNTQTSHPPTSTHPIPTSAAPATPCLAATGVGVSRVPGSLEFRCEECGFWRQDGEPVMKHIQAVHMSGNMLHSVRLPSGLLQVHPIQVVTPISTLASH